MRLGEFWEAMSAYWEEKGSDRRHVAELARGLGIRIRNMLAKKPLNRLDKFWRMPWDSDGDEAVKKIQALPVEERAKLAKQFIERLDNGRKSEN